MRSRPETELRFPEYDNLTTSAKNKLQKEVNKYADSRGRRMEKRNCFVHGERGINLTELPSESQIPSMIATQDWEYFIRKPEPYDEDIVRQFYRDMIPAVYHSKYTVMMGRIQVRISLDDIAEYHHIPKRSELGMSFGLSPIPEFRIEQNPMIARALRRNEERGWDRDKDEIMKADMHYDIALLLLWVRGSLIPSTHVTVADPHTAHVLYSLKRGYPISAPHLIWMEILDAAISLDGALPFPGLITHCCRKKRVELGALTNPMKNLGKRNYNLLVTWAAKKDREAAVEREAERMQQDPNYDEEEYNEFDPEYVGEDVEVDEEDDEEAEEETEEEAEEEHTGDTPPYLTRMNAQWQHQFENINSQFGNINSQLGDINWRLDQMGAPPASERRNTRKRSDRGASSSRHG